MKIHSLETGFFSTDGGAMFGMVSKKVWASKYPVDDENRCPLSMRVLYAEISGHKIIFDTGVGVAQVHGMEYYRFHDLKDLPSELEKIGVNADEITDVVFSHLHFDHCGGSVRINDKGVAGLCFKNALHWASSRQYKLCFNPSLWESDSYAPEIVKAIERKNLLRLIDDDVQLFNGLELKLFNGHTEGQIVSFISENNYNVAFSGDVVPMAPHVIPICIAAVDNCAQVSVDEKMRFLEEAVKRDCILPLYHDAVTKAVKLKKYRDRISVSEKTEL
jgi:glyoxylase-like metal-dependent hydrolase (beta-lactamase superfamily II)